MENWLPPNFISVLFIPAPDLGLGDTYSKRSTNNTLDRVGRAKIGAMTTNIIPPIPVTSMHAAHVHVLGVAWLRRRVATSYPMTRNPLTIESACLFQKVKRIRTASPEVHSGWLCNL
jgi:hypothetical protein